MANIGFFQCLEGFGKFWSTVETIYRIDFVVVGDLLLSWKISADMSYISDSDREQ